MSPSKPRIVYGVHGYGRGHAARALALLPELMKTCEVKVLAGDDAYEQLAAEYPVTRIGVLRYYHNAAGQRSTLATIKRNTPALLDLAVNGSMSVLVEDEMRRFQPDVLISDSEGWTHRAAKRMGIPRISFDHYGVLAYCHLPLNGWDRFVARAESVFYRRLVAEPDRIIVAAFFPAEPRTAGVTSVGPILRKEVRETKPTDGEHLLVYFTNAREHYTQAIEAALGQLDIPVKVYGPERAGQTGNITYCPKGNLPFVRDLASCRAVLSTAGNQLCSEAIHFGKPLLLLPEDALEQRLNAQMVSDWAIGQRAKKNELTAERLNHFLAACPRYAENIPAHRRDGLAEATHAIHTAIDELTAKKQ